MAFKCRKTAKAVVGLTKTVPKGNELNVIGHVFSHQDHRTVLIYAKLLSCLRFPCLSLNPIIDAIYLQNEIYLAHTSITSSYDGLFVTMFYHEMTTGNTLNVPQRNESNLIETRNLFFHKKQMSPPFLLSEISKCP